MLKLVSKILQKKSNKPKLYLNKDVVKNSKRPDYINTKNITIEKREILVGWLIDLVFKMDKCNFKDDVIDMTVNLMDRYLAHPEVKIDESQLYLVCISCLFIANKFWEHVKDIFTGVKLIYVTGKSFTVSELLRMERKVLKTLDYNIWSYSIHFYVDRYANYLELSIPVETKRLTKYALLCHEMFEYNPSEIAAGIIYSINEEWSVQLSEISGSCQSTSEKIADILVDYRMAVMMKNNFTTIEKFQIK